MELKFNEDFVKDNNLTEDQISAVTGFVANEYLPNIKKEWDGKANENAEGILSGAAKYVMEKSGTNLEREKGEKYGDYLQRISDSVLSSKLSAKEKELADKSAELAEKLKNFKGGEEYRAQLEKLENEKDALLKQVAELEPLKGLDVKYKEATESLSGLKLNVAFNNIKPNFPDSVNKYEASAKWEAFKKNTLEKYDIELVDNDPIAIDKDNRHKQIKLSELLSKDGDINELLQGRQQKGNGSRPLDLVDVEGVPFKVPENSTGEERSKLIREYLASKGVSVTSPEYSKKFSELNLKIANAKAA